MELTRVLFKELEFHAGFYKKLDFRQIKFFIETQFSKNRVSKQEYFLNQFRKWAKCQILKKRRAKAHFLPASIGPKSHTHTYTHARTHTQNKSNQFYISKRVKTVQGAYINTCISCDDHITLQLHMYQKQQIICMLCETQQECISVSGYDDLRLEKNKYTYTQS